jgi:hypothetical protein
LRLFQCGMLRATLYLVSDIGQRALTRKLIDGQFVPRPSNSPQMQVPNDKGIVPMLVSAIPAKRLLGARIPSHGDEPLPGGRRNACRASPFPSHDGLRRDVQTVSLFHADQQASPQGYVPVVRGILRRAREGLQTYRWHG